MGLTNVKELIDTCWNVNLDSVIACVDLIGINRYMLECKFR